MNCSLSFLMQPQQQDQWCWAAVSASVAGFFDPATTWTQCLLANAELGQTTCCVDGTTPQCNHAWTLNTALARVGHLRTWGPGAASFGTCDTEVCTSQRPLGVRIGWSGGGGHFVAVTGLGDNTNQLLTVQDPFFGPSQVDYATFVSQYKGTGRWTHSYYTV